jgi:hypothetical protein
MAITMQWMCMKDWEQALVILDNGQMSLLRLHCLKEAMYS